MEETRLSKIIQGLKNYPQVVGVFTTGSSLNKLKPYSDIDLVIILKKNSEKIKSIYTNIDGRFADIFFFDIPFLEQIKLNKNLLANSFKGIFITWLNKGVIHYDPAGALSKYKKNFSKKKMVINDIEKQEYLVKINYNYIANKRYYGASNEIYFQALQIRLAYSVIELCTAYCAIRNIAWRGEKDFITYLNKHDKKYLKNLLGYFSEKNFNRKFNSYEKLFSMTLTSKYKKWEKNFFIVNTTKKLGGSTKRKIKKMFK